MSKRQFKAQASSSRILPVGGAFGSGFGSAAGAFGGASSSLSYLAEQPDLTIVSDPNVVVCFKSLSKKDSTTKAKAIEDLQAYVSSISEQQKELEVGFLDAWVKVYPRLTIDVSRRVRLNTHTVHGQISLCSGKRIARHMPGVIGAWIAGLYDNDKSAGRAAQDALHAVFPTLEKRANLKKAYQLPILEFARDAVLKETTQTLSDERATTPEDAESKYFRVVSSNVLVIDDLLATLPDTETQKHENMYDEIVSSDKTWSLLSSNDSMVRRNVLKLLRTCLEKRQEIMSVNLSSLTDVLLSKQVIRHQSGSAVAYSEALHVLSNLFPSIWTSSGSGKTSAISRLEDLAKAGSQGAPPQYWVKIAKVFESVPEDALPSNLETVSTLVNALRTGITRKDEPRSHAEEAWACYIVVLRRLATNLEATDQQMLMKNHAFTVILQYLNPDTQMVQWDVPGPSAPSVVARLLQIPTVVNLADAEWSSLTDRLLERIQTSSPEQSKEYKSSQEAVGAEATRFLVVGGQALKSGCAEHFSSTILKSVARLLSSSMESLTNRHGKPYGSAVVIEGALRYFEPSFWQHEQLSQRLMAFILTELPLLMDSPSGPHVVSILYACHQQPHFNEAWDNVVEAVLNIEDPSIKLNCLKRLLGSPNIPQSFVRPASHSALQAYITEQVRVALAGEADMSFVTALIGPSRAILGSKSANEMLTSITTALAIQSQTPRAMIILKSVLRSNPQLLQKFLQSADGPNLIQNLLLLTESGDEEVAQSATDINKAMENATVHELSSGASNLSIVNVIDRGLYEANVQSLAIETLIELAQKLVSSSESASADEAKQVLPDPRRWSNALQAFLRRETPPSLSLTNQLGGAIYLVHNPYEPESPESLESPETAGRDKDGYSVAIRIARYMVKMCEFSYIFSTLDDHTKADYYCLLLLTVQLVLDKLGLFECNDLWLQNDPATEREILDFVSDTQKLLTTWLFGKNQPENASASPSDPSFIFLAQRSLFEKSTGMHSFAYHNARAFSFSVLELIETCGWQNEANEDLESRFKSLRRSKDALSFASFVVAYRNLLSPTPAFTRTCNELVAGLTGVKLDKSPDDVLLQLVYLNLIIHDQNVVVETIAKQRLIFFVKHVILWLDDEIVNSAIKAETCKALTVLLPHMKDVYGTHWSEILSFLAQSWNQTPPLGAEDAVSARVSLTHATLRLAATLRKLSSDEDSNDDLKEAQQESSKEASSGLIQLLKSLGNLSDEANQPLQIVNALLGREINIRALDVINNVEDLYPLINVASEQIQRTAFDLLHKHIPAHQEELSVEIALVKSNANFPDEVLSLILDPPTLDSLADASFDRTMPLVLRSYLSSWLLVFDHFKKSSEKVRNDYVSQLKEGDHLGGLLNFTFDFLGHSRAKPIDASKFDARTYSFDIEEVPVKDVQWLLIHLYYLCLKRAPALTKTWWMECKSRQVVVNVETWTEKYISPYIISDTLTTVSEWADAQDASSDEALIIKPNTRTKEIIVSKEIDDQLLSLAIRLPLNFPLGQATLHGVNRVAVDEKKWRSWLLNSQGVITFSNNSLIDGIIAFRRNVMGALKGQTECAICYSIISGDKQLPTKRCGTCKNLFHGSCLYRWFKSSNSSSCPLCRNPFNYS